MRLIIIATIEILTMIVMIISLLIPSRHPFKIMIKFRRVGGFIGEIEELIIYNDGRVLYTAKKRRVFIEGKLPLTIISEIKAKALKILSYYGKNFEPKKGATDFFTYTLEIGSYKVTWVDEWAAKEPVPSELQELQFVFKSVIERISSKL